MLGVLSEFGGGVTNLIVQILILFGLGGIALGLSRKIIYPEIMYSHGKIYLCSKKREDVSFLAVCSNKIGRREIDC